MKLISASRRTDIPAFYSEWFVNRIREGDAYWVNPFSHTRHRVSLRPEDVMAIVFWSKNYAPLLPHLDELDARGYRMVFHFTINGLPRVFEPNVPEAVEMIECARILSGRYGPDAVLWRYDPVLISDATSPDYHTRRFAELCSAMQGLTRRCYFSFTAFHGKVMRGAADLQRRTGIVVHDLSPTDRVRLVTDLTEIASASEVAMFSCCGDRLVGDRIHKAHCMDAELLYRLYPDRIGRLTDLPLRPECGCCECTDIGAYDTCPHGCVYCYANANPQIAITNHAKHDPRANVLGPSADEDARATEPNQTLNLRF